MSNYTAKNRHDPGADRWTIGGELNIITGGKVLGNGTQAAAIANHADPGVATASEVATKQNAILAALRSVGIIAQ